ncbi:MAG: S8 family serine peptidase [Actinomycetota bacterium]
MRVIRTSAAVVLAIALFMLAGPLSAVASNDPRFGDQWGLHKIEAEAAWSASRGDGVSIALIDSGADLSHPDLRGKISGGKDFVDGDNSPDDDNGHGTLTAGIAAASTGNGVGIAGVAPNARIVPVRVFDGAGNAGSDKVAAAIAWAVDNVPGRLVLNLSFVGPGSSLLLVEDVRAAINYATSRGAAVVVAAGNDGADNQYDAPSGSGIIVVGASTREDACSSFTNYGSGVDILAPGGAGGRSSGTDILSTYLGGGYASSSGTSLAAPFVSGAMALLMSQGSSAPSAASRIISSARGPAISCRGESSSYRFLNVASALGVSLAASGPAQQPAAPAPAPPPAGKALRQPGPVAAPQGAASLPAPSAPAPPPTPVIALPNKDPNKDPNNDKEPPTIPLAADLQLPVKNSAPLSPAKLTATLLLVALGAAHIGLLLRSRLIR